MNLSGAPVLLLPRALSASWRGFHVPADPGDELPDLELADGTCWRIDTTFDFDRPRTDYDRLCARLAADDDPCLVPIGSGHGVAFGRGHDAFAWCAEEQLIVGGGAAPEIPDGLPWTFRFTWRNPGSELWLLNACQHGADPDPAGDERVAVSLASGHYYVTRAELDRPATITLCRFGQ